MEWFGKIFEVLTVISDGGPKAIVTILVIGLILIIAANYFLVKFIIKFFEKMTDARDKIVAEKDKLIKERMDKLEQLIEEYNKMSRDILDSSRKLEMSMHDLNSSITQSLNTLFARLH